MRSEHSHRLVDNGVEDFDMCFWDFGNAFDVVNNGPTCANLTALGLPFIIVGWIKSYLANRTF